MGAIALGLVACNNDEVVDNSSNKGEKAYLSIALNLPSSSFKAGTRATEAGTADESKISNVRVVLYNGTTVAEVLDLNVTGDGTAAPTGADVVAGGTAARFKTVGKEVVKATYNLYVFANPNAAVVAATAKGSDISLLKNAQAFAMNDVTGTAKNAFMMSNADGAIVAAVDKATAQLAEAAPFEVKLDRAVAKVTLAQKPDFEKPAGATVTFTGWDVDNTNKKYFLVRELANAKGTSVLETPSTAREDRYAKDPNFVRLYGDNRFIAPYADNFNYLGTVAAPTPTLNNTLGTTAVYVAENTNDANAQYELQSTMVAISAVYTPSGFTASETWVRFGGKFYKKAEIDGFLADRSTINETAHATGFKAAVEALATTYGLAGGIENITDKQIKVAADHLRIYVHKNGVAYYKALIKHFDLTEPMAYGKYGVVRNNVYKLTINKVEGPGAPYLGGNTDPNTPDTPGTPPSDPNNPTNPTDPNTPGTNPSNPNDKDKAFISVDIQVLPWVIREQGVVIGG